MKHILVTGGSGFVGSHLCEALLARGYAVTALDNLVTGREANISEAKKNPNFDFVREDVCSDVCTVETKIPFIKKFGLHGLFHFACPASPVDFDRIPFEILAVDSIGTMKTVDLARKYKARYLLASTSECYGDPHVHPQQEDYWGNVNPIGPRACYDEAKRFAEAYVSTAIRGVNVPGHTRYEPFNAGIVRIFNTYGPRMRPDDGRVVPALCMQAIEGHTLTMHGDGKQTRSFCYVSDLVEGIVRLFESDVKVPVNIGNPVEYELLQFAEILKKLAKKSVGNKFLPARPDDPKRRCPDITRAKTLLKWTPQVSLEEGLAKTLHYFHQESQ
jgi:nucleoside-diphosphate-sugar epimerase